MRINALEAYSVQLVAPAETVSSDTDSGIATGVQSLGNELAMDS